MSETPVAFTQFAGPENAALLPVLALPSTATRRFPAVLALASVGLIEPFVALISVPCCTAEIAAPAGGAVTT